MERFQVSCTLKFNATEKRDEVYDYLYGKKNLAFAMSGDSLTSNNPLDGSYEISCLYRLNEAVGRDEIFDHLLTYKDVAHSGVVEKHTCRHEDNQPCDEQYNEAWGEFNAIETRTEAAY